MGEVLRALGLSVVSGLADAKFRVVMSVVVGVNGKPARLSSTPKNGYVDIKHLDLLT